MNTIDEIISSCENQSNNPIRKFGDFWIEKKLGRGQQGVVLKIKNNINKQFALKFYQPTDRDPEMLKESISRFINEVNTLATLTHKNIVKIFAGGSAIWDRHKCKWKISVGFQKEEVSSEGKELFYYYIMDFIEGYDLIDLYSVFSKRQEEKQQSIFSKHDQLKYFEILIKQVSKAMIYYHSKNITHKDIKPQNIRFSIADRTFILVDFGFAHHIDSPQDIVTIPRVDYIDLPSIENQDYEKNDMGQFCKMLEKLLPQFENEYMQNRYLGLQGTISIGKHSDLNSRFKNMEDFYRNIKQYFLLESGWKFQLKLDEYLTPDRFGRFDSKLRIPVSGSILLTKEIRSIIDTSEFQRLRGVRQLGPTMFVFPGANHTRFEHSLGVYYLSMRYLQKLFNLSHFKSKCDPIDNSIKKIILTALLHDIGHYPYSHWIEEIKELPNHIKLKHHEERAKDILTTGNICKVIEEVWEIDPNDISNLITSNSNNQLINSFINSVVDSDKLDYLVRDSIHCGVDYGKGIDLERIIDSLYVDERSSKICLTEKGRSSLISILATRNIMYQEVYWHKTVRASDAMFKKFFYVYVKSNAAEDKERTLRDLKELLNRTDDEFINHLYHWAYNFKHDIVDLVKPFAYKGRNTLFKPAFVYYSRNTTDSPKVHNYFRKVFGLSYSQLLEQSENLVSLMKSYLPDITTHDIILERTPIKTENEKYLLDGFNIYNTKKGIFENHPTEIESLNNYLDNNKQAYIFCHPKYYEKIRELFLVKDKLGDILSEL